MSNKPKWIPEIMIQKSEYELEIYAILHTPPQDIPYLTLYIYLQIKQFDVLICTEYLN